MIDVLKKEIENQYGSKILDRGDCEFIANYILEQYDTNISYNTLRRFFGLVEKTKPNTRTLNALSKYAGFKSYSHFIDTYHFKEERNFHQIVYHTIYRGKPSEIIRLVNSAYESKEDFPQTLILIVRELYYSGNNDLIDIIFNLKELHYSNFSYTELLYIGNSIGLIFRKQGNVPDIISNNQNFINIVFLTFVDYSSLNNYYLEWANHIKNKTFSEEISIFISAITEFRKFLNKKQFKNLPYETMFSKELNPILCSRLLSLYILKNNKIDLEHKLNQYYRISSKRINTIDYSYELFITSIIAKNKDLMFYLINNLELEKLSYYQRIQKNTYNLMCLFYYKLTGNLEKEEYFFDAFSINLCQFSYQEFVALIFCIYKFHSTNNEDKKLEIITEYNYLKDKFGYSLFTKEFILNYFN